MTKKLTIEYVKQFIEEKHPGTICKFTNYKNNYTKLDLVCENGHEYKPIFINIEKGFWCPECSGYKKHTISQIKNVIEALHQNAICKFTEYKNLEAKLDFICENGHDFKISFAHILKGNWCAECAGNKKLTIEQVKEKIKEKHPGTICNFIKYKNAHTKLDLVCENEHGFKINYNSIQQDCWCPECYGNKKLTIEYVKTKIEELHPGCICKFTEYKNIDTKLDLVCENGHEYKASFANIKNNNWCSECSKLKKLTIEYVKNYINEMHPGAICNSVEYKNAHKKLNLICENEHEYKASFSNIKSGRWCSKCSEHKSEKYIRSAFKELTDKEFIKTKPEWLINSKTNGRLELDGFNQETKIAFECQGQQHYDLNKKFHKNEDDFISQQYRDKIKKELCKANNIKLICVPAIGVKVDGITYTKKLIKNYIKEQLSKI